MAPKMVATLAAAGLVWQAANFAGWVFRSPSSDVSALQPPPATPAADAGIDFQHIARAHLFGRLQDQEAVDPKSLPAAQVSLIVTGTIALQDPQAGFALVGESTGVAKLYRAGAAIGKLAQLHSVYQDRVIIDRGGTLETLLLPRLTLHALVMPVTQSEPTRESVAQSAQVIAEKLEEVDHLTNNSNALGEVMRSQPVFANGSLMGFRVYPRRSRTAFTRAGLQSGDLVTAINGMPLNSSQSNGVLGQLSGSNVANVTISRSGQELQITLDIAQLALAD